ncbi:MAG: glycosyltransferase [Krumholzibacteria bacterium]|nr:glycosyltransferase [Candidatus Krumholzibacteria bacterium]
MVQSNTSTHCVPWHVVHVIGTLRTGGAEMQLVNYLFAADRTAFRHTVLCLTGRGELADTVESAGVPVHVIRARLRRMPLDLWAIAQWLRREHALVVHTHLYGAAFWGRLAGMLAGVPVLMTTEHGQETWKGRLHIAADRWLTKRTWRHIAVSKDVLEIRRRRERVAADKIVLVPNGVPIPKLEDAREARVRCRAGLGIAPDRPVVGSVGRMTGEKAYHDLLAAVDLLRRQVPDICWLQVGEGRLRDELAADVMRRGLQDHVVMAGRRDDVGDLLAVMDVWAMSSVREGLPVSLLEAMASARPIVATRVGGIPDAVTDGESALLVPPADPPALAAAIGRLLADRDLAKRLATVARARATAEYGIAGVARRIEDNYREGLAARSSRGPRP